MEFKTTSMKALVWAIFGLSVVLGSCKKKNDTVAPSSCADAFVFDSLRSSDYKTAPRYYTYIYGKNFFCQQDSIIILALQKNTCAAKDTTIKIVIKKSDDSDPNDNNIHFLAPDEMKGKANESQMFYKLVHGKDTVVVNPVSKPVVYRRCGFAMNSNNWCATKGDTISLTVGIENLDDVGQVYVNDILCPAKAIVQNTIDTQFSLALAVPAGLTSGYNKVKVYNKCGQLFDAYRTVGTTSDTGFYYTTKPLWFLPKVAKRESSSGAVYDFSVMINKGYYRSFTIKLKNSNTGTITTLKNNQTSFGFDYWTYYYFLPVADYAAGPYEVIVEASDKAVYENAIGTGIVFK